MLSFKLYQYPLYLSQHIILSLNPLGKRVYEEDVKRSSLSKSENLAHALTLSVCYSSS